MQLETTGWRLNNMPELPEVETVKNGLKNIYCNKIIDNVIVNHNNIIANKKLLNTPAKRIKNL